jgi:hypothetical protein
MKKILTIALILTAGTSAFSQSNKTTHGKTTPAVRPAGHKHAQAAAIGAAAPASAAATDDSANYVGTNDFYLALVREGVRKA